MTSPNAPYDPRRVYEAFTEADGYNRFLDEGPMNLDDVIDLLSLLAGSDYRKPDPGVAAVWLTAAVVGRWSKGAAFRAAATHVATTTEFAKPAHITNLIKAEKATIPTDRLAIEGANRASENARTAAVEFFRRHPEHLSAFKMPPPGSARAQRDPEAAKRYRNEANARLARYWRELDERKGAS